MGRYCRQSVTAADLLQQLLSIADMDAGPRLGEITAPTLVTHFIDDGVIPVGAGRSSPRTSPEQHCGSWRVQITSVLRTRAGATSRTSRSNSSSAPGQSDDPIVASRRCSSPTSSDRRPGLWRPEMKSGAAHSTRMTASPGTPQPSLGHAREEHGRRPPAPLRLTDARPRLRGRAPPHGCPTSACRFDVACTWARSRCEPTATSPGSP